MKAGLIITCVVALWFGSADLPAFGQTTISGRSLALRSTGSGTDSWTLDRNGYVGTYISVPAAGPVDVRVNAIGAASGGIPPHMSIVLADAKAGFDVGPGASSYEHTFHLPAGTYFLRTQFDNDLERSPRALTVQNITVTGATVSNTSTSANALAAADSYIQNFRRGNVSVHLTGADPGATVEVSLKRHAFSFGTAVPGNSAPTVNSYLGSSGTTRQTNYQMRLNENFNAIVPENAGKWSNNEAARDAPTMNSVDQILNYAQSHGMRARMHNLLWGDNSFNGQQPSWVLNNNSTTGLLDQAYLGISPTAAADLRDEISERIDYYIGTGTSTDRAHKYVEVDVYNESYHTGQDPNLPENLKHNYWNVYGPAGIADVYREVRDTIAAAGGLAKAFVNEYGVLGSSDYGGWYFNHIEELRQAGIAAGYGDVVGGIGVQHYPGSTQNAGNIMRTLQNLSVQGLPLALTEFGISSGVAESTAATILGDILRLAFGTQQSTGFFMWGFHQESGPGANTLFAPAAALYTVNTSDFNNWTLTAAGRKWQDLLGIHDWDGNPNNGWGTHLTSVVDANGMINFNGFWGDYELTVNGETLPLTLVKGEADYSLIVPTADYNDDGVVNAADYVVWRKASATQDLRADGNRDGTVDTADYNVWRARFGKVYGNTSSMAATVPEPQAWLVVAVAVSASLLLCGRLNHRFECRLRSQFAVE